MIKSPDLQKPTDFKSLSDQTLYPYRRNPEYEGEFYGEIPLFIGIGTWTPQQSEESEELLEKNLNFIESEAIVTVLEDAIDELGILKYIIGVPIVHWDLSYKSLDEKFKRRLSPERTFPEVDDKPLLTSEIKLQREREQIEIVLSKTIKSLLEEGSYLPLINVLEVLKRHKDDEEKLLQEVNQNFIHLKELKVKVNEKRKLDDQEERERDELVYKLQDELDDVKLKCEVEQAFAAKWESVRRAQNLWQLRAAENFYRDNIAKFATKTRLEKRVTHELSSYLKFNQQELETQLEDWMSTYDSEMERRENKILHLKYDRDQAEEKKHQLQDLYDERTKLIDEWVEFRELRKRRTDAILQIQSWWRGLMVRKKLGPYKPKKNKEQSEEKKKKKKKKKAA